MIESVYGGIGAIYPRQVGLASCNEGLIRGDLFANLVARESRVWMFWDVFSVTVV